MSLELALQQATAAFTANTAAVEKLIKLLESGAVSPAALPEEIAAATEPEPPKAKRTKGKDAPAPKAEEPATGEQSAPEQSAASLASTTTAETAAPPTYTETAKHVTDLARKDRQAAVEVLSSFGAKTLGEVKASSYADVIAACKARM